MADAMEVGKRYRDTVTGHHVLVIYGAPADAELGRGAEWGYVVTSQPDGTLSEDMGTLRWAVADLERYVALDYEPSTVLAELRNVLGLLFDEVDPNDEDGDWDADRLPALALAACTLFEAVDSRLLDGGSLPLEWNPYVVEQQCRVPHVGCNAYDDAKHCRCMRRRRDGAHRLHKCACGHEWET